MPTAQCNGVLLSYAVDGDGAPVAFIHGGFGGPATTKLVRESMIAGLLPADRFRLLTYDRRSAGESEFVVTPYRLSDITDDLYALLTHLSMAPAIIIGDSMGGMVAQEFALRHPESVAALCLVETGANMMATTPWGQEGGRLVERTQTEGDHAVFESVKDVVRNPPEPPFTSRPSLLRDRARANRAATMERLAQLSEDELFQLWRGQIRNYGAFWGVDLAPRLHELPRVPTCIIHGDSDSIVPQAMGRDLARLIPYAEFHSVPGGDHGVLLYPEAAEALRGWVMRVAGA